MPASFFGAYNQTFDTLVASKDLSRQADAQPLISWQPGWIELDLATGLAIDSSGNQTFLDPADFSTLPRAGIRLADVSVLGSGSGNRVFVGLGSLVDAAAGSDELFNSDSQGDNLLIAGTGTDTLYLRAVNDRIIGGTRFADATAFNLSPLTGLADGEQDHFLLDSSDPGTTGALQILDFEPSVDQLLIDGSAVSLSDWSGVRQRLDALNVSINAAPTTHGGSLIISLKDDVDIQQDLSSLGLDADNDTLELLKISGPDWINISGTVLEARTPAGITEDELANTPLILAFTDGKAVSISFTAQLTLNASLRKLELTNVVGSLPENTSTASHIKVADIIISDDALGSSIITLSGDDAVHFEVINTTLFLKAGTTLDYESKNSYNLTVSATDPALAGSIPVSSSLSLAISDLNEIPGDTSVTTQVSIKLPNGDDKVVSVKINNADLASGSNLSIISNLGIQESDLSRLGELNIKSSASGLDFRLSINQGESASVSAALELVAADLLPELSDPLGNRRADRKLIFYGVTGGGALTPLTYDPITGAGARFYDLDNDGVADFFTLSLIDGGYGDKDGLVNGVIDDPSFAGFADLANLHFIDTGSGTVTIKDPSNASPAAVSIRATLSGRASTSNQIGYVVLSADEMADTAALQTNLDSLQWLRNRALTLYSSLESGDVTLPADLSLYRDIQLINGQSIRFFEVIDSDLDEISSLNDGRFRYINSGVFGGQQVAFGSGSGVRFSLSFFPGDPGLNALVAQVQGKAPVLDLSAFAAGQGISGVMRFGREADFNASLGFYRALDAAGTVVAADGITRLRPGEVGYANAALQATNRVGQISDVTVADDRTAARGFSSIAGGGFLAPFALVNGHTFFAYSQANVDKISHFRALGSNAFGFEDTMFGGDRDYDDMIIAFDFTSVA